MARWAVALLPLAAAGVAKKQKATWKQTVAGAASNGWIMWEGVNVTRYTHVDGQGGGRTLLGSWSDPFNSTSNTLCSSSASAPASQRCPAPQAVATAFVLKTYVEESQKRLITEAALDASLTPTCAEN